MKAYADGWFALRTEYLQVCGLPLWLHAFADSSGITTGGQSPGHIAVHDTHRGVLFTFDDVQGRRGMAATC